jgi:hypothetical protein
MKRGKFMNSKGMAKPEPKGNTSTMTKIDAQFSIWRGWGSETFEERTVRFTFEREYIAEHFPNVRWLLIKLMELLIGSLL